MRQSTPLNQLDPSPQGVEMQEDDQVQDVLQSINETFAAPPQPPSNFLPALPPQFDQYASVQMPTETGIEPSVDNDKIDIMGFLTYELKLAILSAIIFIVVCFVPVEQFVFKYAALEKIPFANVYIKAMIAGALFYFAVKLIS